MLIIFTVLPDVDLIKAMPMNLQAYEKLFKLHVESIHPNFWHIPDTTVTVTYMHALTADDRESHSSHSLLHQQLMYHISAETLSNFDGISCDIGPTGTRVEIQ